MRKNNIKQYCVDCKYREIGGERAENWLREKGYGTAYFTCYGYRDEGMKLSRMKENMCPMIRDAKENYRQYMLAKKKGNLAICERDIRKLLERKERLEKEIAELEK